MPLCTIRNIVIDIIKFPENLSTTSDLRTFLHGVISLPDETSYDNIDTLSVEFPF